jgi:hypothetical protein
MTNAITIGIPTVIVDVRLEKQDLLISSGENTIKEFAIIIDAINDTKITMLFLLFL